MSWLSILKVALTLLASFAGWLGRKQLLEAGAAEQLQKNLLEERDRVEKANTVRNNLQHDADSVRTDKNNRSKSS